MAKAWHGIITIMSDRVWRGLETACVMGLSFGKAFFTTVFARVTFMVVETYKTLVTGANVHYLCSAACKSFPRSKSRP